jgi:hypothetical protein
MQKFEMEYLKKDPTIIIMSRIIFAHMNTSSSLWINNYTVFFEKNIETISRINNFGMVLEFFKNHHGCDHFFLAVDELIHLDFNSSGIKSVIIQNAIKLISNIVIASNGFHAIISSLVTNPIQEFLKGSQYTPIFIRLRPLLENLDILSRFIARKRNDPSIENVAWRLLLSTGGHPKLLKQMIDWLVQVSKKDMDFSNALVQAKFELSNPNEFTAEVKRLFFIGGCIPPEEVGAICGLSGMLCRPNSAKSPISITIPPLVLYFMIKNTSKHFNSLNPEYLKCLVPFRISSGDHFENFLACWFGFQFELTRSLRSLFVIDLEDKSSFLLCTDLFRISRESFLFQKRPAFLNSLPNFVTSKFVINLSTIGDYSNLFGLESPSEGYRVLVIENRSNLGFDFMINFSNHDTVVKKVLLVQCKSKLVTTTERNGPGQIVGARSFYDSLVKSNEFATILEKRGWEVSFLGIYSCKTSTEVIPEVCPNGVSQSFFDRSAAIGNGAIFGLLGDSFGLALELAKGHKFSHYNCSGIERNGEPP